MNWFTKLLPPKIKSSASLTKKGVPEGIWVKCPECTAVLYQLELGHNLNVCPKCNHHMRIGGMMRVSSFLDPGTIEQLKGEVKPVDKLKFRDSKKIQGPTFRGAEKNRQFGCISGGTRHIERVAVGGCRI